MNSGTAQMVLSVAGNWRWWAAGTALYFVFTKVIPFFRADADLPTFKAPPSNGHFKDKVVMITGASSGIGEALAHVFAEDGAKIILSSRRIPELQRVKASLPCPESDVAIVRMDVGALDEIPARMEEAKAAFGRVDVLVNNAGITTRALASEIEFDVIKRVCDVDYLGQVAVTKAVLPGMLERGYGHVINVSSFAGKMGWVLRSAYSGAKFALIGFMDAVRLENFDKGIQVTNTCPGPVDTAVSKNALTASGTKFGVTVHGNGATESGKKVKGLMTARRCAELMVNGAAAGVEEQWIMEQPILMMLYFNQYFPSIARTLSRKQAPKGIQDFRKAQAAKGGKAE